MEEINSGISSAAEAVQNQLLQTEAIQDRIENVQEAADKIDQNVDPTMSAVVATEISNMSTQTKEATENISDLFSNATSSLDDLVKSVTEMSSVIQSKKSRPYRPQKSLTQFRIVLRRSAIMLVFSLITFMDLQMPTERSFSLYQPFLLLHISQAISYCYRLLMIHTIFLTN